MVESSLRKQTETGQLKVNCKRNESTSKQSNRTQNLNHNQPEETKN